jgi:hypothetical protein
MHNSNFWTTSLDNHKYSMINLNPEYMFSFRGCKSTTQVRDNKEAK